MAEGAGRREDRRPPTLELELGAPEVAFRHLVSASSTFAQLINEVARSYTGAAEPLRWIVNVEPGSVRLPLRAEPATEEVALSATTEVVNAISEGIALIEARAERPPYFSDRALGHARALANMSSPDVPILVRNGREVTTLSRHLTANVDEVLGAPLYSYGTVEGRLEAVNLHGPRPIFAVYENLNGHRVECRLTDRVTLDDLRPALGRRVGVRGPIRSRGSGERISVEAHELMVLPTEDELPEPDEVLGILRGYETDLPF